MWLSRLFYHLGLCTPKGSCLTETLRQGEPMSKHETTIMEGFWRSHARGAFLPEYPLVRTQTDRAMRRADAIILPDEPHGRANVHDYPSLSGRKVIVVQTKPGLMGMYFNGSSPLFSSSRNGSRSNQRSLHITVPPDRRSTASALGAVSRGRGMAIRSGQSGAGEASND